MNEGVCPKCHGREVYGLMPQGEDSVIQLGWIKNLPIRHAVCALCGYMETYVRDPELLDKVRKHGWRIGEEGGDAQ
jgi:hypothetical protein